MSGQEIRDLLLDNDIVLADLAKKLGISPQALNSKLNAKNISVEFVEDISKAINKNVYNLDHKKSIKKPNPTELNIEVLNTSLALLNRLVDNLERENKFYNSLLSKEINDGAYLTKEKYKKA